MAEHETEAVKDLKSEIRRHISRLLGNWGKNGQAATIAIFVDMAVRDGYTAEQVEAGVDRCIRNWQGENAPQGWAKFAPYLPSASRSAPKEKLPWVGSGVDGDWGGDWSDVPVRRWITVAGMFQASLTMAHPDGRPWLTTRQRERAEEFLVMARKRVAIVDIEHAAKAAREGRLNRFVSDWMELRRAKLRGDRQEQEALAV